MKEEEQKNEQPFALTVDEFEAEIHKDIFIRQDEYAMTWLNKTCRFGLYSIGEWQSDDNRYYFSYDLYCNLLRGGSVWNSNMAQSDDYVCFSEGIVCHISTEEDALAYKKDFLQHKHSDKVKKDINAFFSYVVKYFQDKKKKLNQ